MPRINADCPACGCFANFISDSGIDESDYDDDLYMDEGEKRTCNSCRTNLVCQGDYLGIDYEAEYRRLRDVITDLRKHERAQQEQHKAEIQALQSGSQGVAKMLGNVVLNSITSGDLVVEGALAELVELVKTGEESPRRSST